MYEYGTHSTCPHAARYSRSSLISDTCELLQNQKRGGGKGRGRFQDLVVQTNPQVLWSRRLVAAIVDSADRFNADIIAAMGKIPNVLLPCSGRSPVCWPDTHSTPHGLSPPGIRDSTLVAVRPKIPPSASER